MLFLGFGGFIEFPLCFFFHGRNAGVFHYTLVRGFGIEIIFLLKVNIAQQQVGPGHPGFVRSILIHDFKGTLLCFFVFFLLKLAPGNTIPGFGTEFAFGSTGGGFIIADREIVLLVFLRRATQHHIGQ